MKNKTDINIVTLHNAFSSIKKVPPEFMAASLYLIRRDRWDNPEGCFDNAGRWYAHGRDAAVMAPCRTPSRAWPYSEMTSCRTLHHCARYYEADTMSTQRAARAIEHITNGNKLPKTAEKYVPQIKAAACVATLP